MFLGLLFWRFYDFLVALIVPRFIPYLGTFSHPKVLKGFVLSQFIRSFANFDGIFYIRIAQQGYSQFEQAFFPLYPLLMKFISPIFANNLLITGLVISNLAFLIGVFVFYKYLSTAFVKAGGNPRQDAPSWTIIFLLSFPTSFFFGALYTESLFFLLVVCSLYFLKKENYLLAGLFAALSSATRLVGIFLIIPFAFEFFRKKRFTFYVSNLTFLLSPFLGLASYMFYLYKTVADPLAFFHSQTAFQAGRETKLILLPQVYFRYLKIFLTAPRNFTYFVSILEFTIFSLVFLVLLYQIWNISRQKNKDFTLIGLVLFSLANILLPTFTGTLLSTPRFALLSLSFFIFLANIKSLWIKSLIALIFILLHTVLLGFFVQGWFIS